MTTNTGPSRLLKPTEVAAILGVSTWTINNLARKKQIPHVRIGRFARFEPEAIDGWIKSGGLDR